MEWIDSYFEKLLCTYICIVYIFHATRTPIGNGMSSIYTYYNNNNNLIILSGTFCTSNRISKTYIIIFWKNGAPSKKLLNYFTVQ